MKRIVRYAVVGLGHIAQKAVLPAFADAKGTSVLAALISSDPVKLRSLGRNYAIDRLYAYEQYDECLCSGEVDAVYIALPNHLHAAYTVRAAKLGVHVLCEKPMAVTSKECMTMIRACEKAGVRFMVAYRLHFEPANRSVTALLRSGKIGEPRLITSSFTLQVPAGNVRLQKDVGGGPLYDIGIYCINAARNLFGDEPVEVTGVAAGKQGERFEDVEEMFSGMLRFPGGRLANFSCSFGGSSLDEYRVIGTEGSVRLDPAYGYGEALARYVTAGGKTRGRKFPRHDQFAAQFDYFSDCVLRGIEPGPDGWEGMADVRIIEALYRSVKTGCLIELPPLSRVSRMA